MDAQVPLFPEEPPYDASDEEVVKKRKKSAALKAQQNKAVLVSILSTPEGRNWMWSILSDMAVFHTILPDDALKMSYQLGSRNVGLKLLNEITSTAPQAYIQMLREQGNA